MARCGNIEVVRGMAGSFGCSRRSDCVIVFCPEGNAPNTESSAASGTIFGEPLPAHSFVLDLASERFASQLERWASKSPAGQETKCSARKLSATADNAADATTADAGDATATDAATDAADTTATDATDANGADAATAADTAADTADAIAAAAAAAAATDDGQPQLRIPLGSEAEVPAARAAIRFAYTGEVAADISVREVLEVRRQGAYLQIKDCVAACDSALESKLQGSTANAGASAANTGSNKRRRTEAPQQVYDLYGSEGLWPDPQVEASFAAVLAVGKRRLVAHFGDALQTLNHSSLRDQLLALPAVALEALLESDDFGTDSESTVLLLLAVWMKANFEKTSAEIRQRLCRTVRLAHLSRPYLSLVLPALAVDHDKDPEGQTGWFSGVSVMGAVYVANFNSASECERQELLSARQKVPSIVASLTVTPRAQCIPPADGLTYSWHITKGQLQRGVELLELRGADTVSGIFEQLSPPQDGPSAWGFNWRVFIKLTSEHPSAGLFLECGLPDALVSPGSLLSGEDSLARCTAVPISAQLTVHRRQGRAQSNMQFTFSSSKDFVSVGRSRGWSNGLPLREQQQPPVAAGGSTAGVSAVDPLAAWVEYLQDDKITGTLTLLRPA